MPTPSTIPAMKPNRCAPRSVFSPAVPVNASRPNPATIGAMRARHGVSRRKPRRHVYATSKPSAANTAVDAPIERCAGPCAHALSTLAPPAASSTANQPTPAPRYRPMK